MATVASGGATPFVGEATRLRRRYIFPRSSLSSRKIEPSVKTKAPPTRGQLRSEPDSPNPIRISGSDNGNVGREVLDRSEVAPRGIRDYIKLSRELIGSAKGSVRWFSPIECAQCGEESPLLLYLPGIDGVGTGLVRHYARLGKIFNIWCLHIPVDDRTTFEELIQYIENTVKSEKTRLQGRPIYIVGESIGACFALAVAARSRNTDLILILVNPATSFKRTWLRDISTLLDAVPDPFHVPISSLFSLLSGNYIRTTTNFKAQELAMEEAIPILSEGLTDMLPSLSLLGDILPKESLIWKLKILKEASSYVNSRLHAVTCQTLILASGKDEILPSHEEADRLCTILPNCRVRHFQDSGHALLLERGLDLVTVIKGAGYYRRTWQTDLVSDYLHPTTYEFENVSREYRLTNFATDPVMFSTLGDGHIIRGLSGIPDEGPAVFIGNHMLMGSELGPLVIQFLKEKNILLRGIAHPFMFDRNAEMLMPDYSSFDKYRIMGSVPVSGINLYKLLAINSFVLLYPGGAREALHKKGEEYQLFWPQKSEFVRMASRFGATIIPFGVVGEDDLYNILLDYNDLKKLPFYDSLDKKLNEGPVGAAVRLRSDYEGEVANQELHPIVLAPKIPGRFYFLFGKPIKTKGMEKELRDRDNAQQMYLQVKSEVEKCLSYLREKREKDPYRSIFSRLVYQATHGSNSEIPTFEP
ncbi:Esterase/lipase/thioesterase family protein [Rhynchospora pubera]|uniref:Esterase/lipase/thioesterase family protein n=1 Tax=Rhynchospora pubera TaxID=906938 RepID=A0AAV8EEP4_9POAL|nr:Esterase/lipase/thioesterase family protein [Rhynchospora pubera]